MIPESQKAPSCASVLQEGWAGPPCFTAAGPWGWTPHGSISCLWGFSFPIPQGPEDGICPERPCPAKPKELGAGSPLPPRAVRSQLYIPIAPVLVLNALTTREF